MKPRTLEDGREPTSVGRLIPEDFAGHLAPAARCHRCGLLDGLVADGDEFRCSDRPRCAEKSRKMAAKRRRQR